MVIDKKEYNKMYYQKNREKILERTKQWKKNNPEKIKQYDKIYYYKNYKNKGRTLSKEQKVKRNKRLRAYYLKNREKILMNHKQHYNQNKKKVSRNFRLYNQPIQSKIKKRLRQRNYYMEKRKNDPGYRLSSNVSRSMRLCLQTNKNGWHWETLVDYSLEDLKKHLEKQFKKGMTWKNYGKVWHIDHRIPQSKFKFKSHKDKQFKQCWSLENLQPLEAKKNFVKCNLYSEPTLNQILKKSKKTNSSPLNNISATQFEPGLMNIPNLMENTNKEVDTK